MSIFAQSLPNDDDYERRVARIEGFQEKYRYAPGVGLAIVADTLYEEVGELAVMLINLKIKRAEALIAHLGQVHSIGDTSAAKREVPLQ